MKKQPKWYVKWSRHPYIYYRWSAAALTMIGAIAFVHLMLPPLPGSAQGLSNTKNLPEAHNVPKELEKIPGVNSTKEADKTKNKSKNKGMTLQQQCQAELAEKYWSVCCVPKEYTTSEACKQAMKKQPEDKQKAEQEQAEEPKDDNKPLTPAELKLLPVAWQKEFSQLKKQVDQFEKQAEQANAEIQTMAACELGCPGGAGAIRCSQENIEFCKAHDTCIKACDKDFPKLEAKVKKLQKTEKELIKKGEAFGKKVEAYKIKNARKFRAIQGADR